MHASIGPSCLWEFVFRISWKSERAAAAAAAAILAAFLF